MRKLLLATVLVLSLSSVTFAGDIPFPPGPEDPPPCTENCMMADEGPSGVEETLPDVSTADILSGVVRVFVNWLV